LFAKTMALGPYAAHAPLLERGIDALTLHVRLTSSPQANYLIIDLIRYLEGIVRALSNLHERLHHSMTQYLMPSPLKFVSHSEYLIPNLLLVVPLLVRAVGLILVQDLPGGFDLQALPVGAATVVASFSIYQCSPHVETTHLTALLAILYILAPVILHRNVTIKPSTHQSVLFVTCLLAIYTILPLILSNVAVAFGLSLVWSPLISMQAELQRLPSWIMLTLLVTTWPPTLLLSWFNGYTPFVILAFLPLHLLMYLLFHCTYSSNSNQQEKQ
jgi:glycosylphosphatidylinositol transamidase